MFALRTLLARLWGGARAGEITSPKPPRDWATRAVWGVWFGMTAWVFVFVLKHGRNLPVTDEWAFVSVYYAGWREKLTWLFEQHCEHRFILGRAIFLGLLWLTGLDFRAGMWATVLFLAAASAVLILAARKLRGRTHPVDLVFPLLMLHVGHTENLLMGYQLVFTLTVLHLALFALLVAYSESLRPATSALLGAALLVPISLGGGQGLAFVPPMGCWVAWQWIRTFRAGEFGWRSWVAGLILAAVAGYAAWAAFEQFGHTRKDAVRNPPWETLRVAAQVFGMGIGPVGMLEKPAVGWVLLMAEGFAAVALIAVVWRRPVERPVAAGLLALLGGVFAFALAIGHSRDSGWCSRFAAFSALGPAVIALGAARYLGPVRRHTLWIVLVVALGATTTAANAWHASRLTITLDHVYRAFLADVKAGIPIDLLAARNSRMWHYSANGWRILWKNRFPLLAGIPGPYKGPSLPVAFTPDDTPDPNPTLVRRCYRIALPERMQLLAVRVVFRVDVRSAWEGFHLQWNDPDTGKSRVSALAAWVHPGVDEETVFIVRGPITSGRFFMGREGCPVRVLRVELLPLQIP